MFSPILYALFTLPTLFVVLSWVIAVHTGATTKECNPMLWCILIFTVTVSALILHIVSRLA